jgi:hypothetical protein
MLLGVAVDPVIDVHQSMLTELSDAPLGHFERCDFSVRHWIGLTIYPIYTPLLAMV